MPKTYRMANQLIAAAELIIEHNQPLSDRAEVDEVKTIIKTAAKDGSYDEDQMACYYIVDLVLQFFKEIPRLAQTKKGQS